MRKFVICLATTVLVLGACKNNQNTSDMQLTQQWDKVFPKSEKVDHQKVTFKNRYGITLAADMYTPKNAEGKLAAIAVSGPFGAVKEQCSGLMLSTWPNGAS